MAEEGLTSPPSGIPVTVLVPGHITTAPQVAKHPTERILLSVTQP